MKDAAFRSTLEGLAQGTIPIAQAYKALGLRADFSLGTNPAWIEWRKQPPLGMSAPLRVGDIRGGLNRFLAGSWTAHDLHLWAQFITLVDAYEFPQNSKLADDHYDDVWDIIFDLSSPEIHGAASESSVRRQLAVLARYQE